MLQAAGLGGPAQQPWPPGGQYPAAAPAPASPARRPLHEPRQPALSPVSGAKRRQVASPRPPSRWDYRPAWSEAPPRVDDLPVAAASARARQSAAAEAAPQWPASTGVLHPQPAAPAWQQAPAPQAPSGQQGWGQAPAAASPSPSLQPHSAGFAPAASQPGPPQQLQQPQHAFPMQLPAVGPGSAGAAPPSGAVIYQCFAPGCSPPPALQQQWVWGRCGTSTAADPQTRPGTSWGQQQQLAPPAPPQQQQHHHQLLPALWPPGTQQPAAAPQGWVGQPEGGYAAAVPEAQQQAQYQQRPATPGAGLWPGCGSTAGPPGTIQAWPPVSGAATPRPRSAAAKVRQDAQRRAGPACSEPCIKLPSSNLP